MKVNSYFHFQDFRLRPTRKALVERSYKAHFNVGWGLLSARQNGGSHSCTKMLSALGEKESSWPAQFGTLQGGAAVKWRLLDYTSGLRWIVLFETSNLTPVCLQSLVYTPAYNLSSAFDFSHLCPFSRPPCMVFIHESFKSFVFVLTFLPSKLFLLWCTPCWMLWQPARAVF